MADSNSGGKSRAYAALVALGIFTSRIFGFVRESVFGYFFGTSLSADAFKAALRIPNFMQNLLGEGVLSASFIPVYAKLLAEKDEETAGRVAGIVFTLLALVVSIIVLVGVVAAPLLVDLITPGFDDEARSLTILLTRILFPGVGLLVLSAWCLGMLNSHRIFFLSYVAPTILNVAMIVTLIWFGRDTENQRLAVILAWGAVIGMFLQFAIQVPSVLRNAPEIRYGLGVGLAPVREVIRNFVPVVIGRGAVQVSSFVDVIIVSFLAKGALATLMYAQTIYLLPISLFGMSVAASELPQMSGTTGTDEEVAATLRKRLHAGLRQIAFFIAPSAMAFVFIGNELVGAVYQRGEFNAADTRLVWYVLVVIAIGLLGVTFSRLLSSTYYALRDTRTPLRYALVRIVTSAVLAYLFAVPLRPLLVGAIEALRIPIPAVQNAEVALGILGIAIGSVVGAWLEYFLLKRTLRARIGDFSEEPSFLLKLWGAATIAGVVGLLVARPTAVWVESFVTDRYGIDELVGGAIAAALFGLTYMIVAIILRIPETRAILRRIPLASNFLAKG